MHNPYILFASENIVGNDTFPIFIATFASK